MAINVEPLSTFLGTKAPSAAAAIDFPEWKDGTEFSAGLFPYFDFVLTLVKTPKEEQALMKRFAKIGLMVKVNLILPNSLLRFKKP
jgi:hypothetical protein